MASKSRDRRVGGHAKHVYVYERTSADGWWSLVECIVSMRGSRKFCQGVCVWGGGGSLTAWKQPGQRFFFVFCFLLVLNLFYSLQRGSNGFITEKTILFKGSRESNFSKGGVQGPSLNFYRNPYNLWFSGGGSGPPITPSGSANGLIAG